MCIHILIVTRITTTVIRMTMQMQPQISQLTLSISESTNIRTSTWTSCEAL
jgi:hypothetical protein